jgi:hypothetical protein
MGTDRAMPVQIAANVNIAMRVALVAFAKSQSQKPQTVFMRFHLRQHNVRQPQKKEHVVPGLPVPGTIAGNIND